MVGRYGLSVTTRGGTEVPAPIGRMRSAWIALAVGIVSVFSGTQPVAAEDLGSPYPDELQSVSVLTTSDVWAVGFTGYGQTAVLQHWDGQSWTEQASPRPGKLYGVIALAANNVWAVGGYPESHTVRSLILHWDGASWSQIPSPNPSTFFNQFEAVSATSANNVWAVGYSINPTTHAHYGLTVHWDGARWSANANPGVQLDGVATTTATNAWAVGAPANVLHWNGTSWAKQYSIGGATLFDIAAPSSTYGWAVGELPLQGGKTQTLIVRWNGHSWTRIPSPNVNVNYNTLFGVSATSATNAWAVGCYGNGSSCAANNTLVLHWNGSTWTRVATPHPGATGNRLADVSALSPTAAWTVGATQTSDGATSMVRMRWDGAQWALT